ncbi:MAG: molybdate ABC transporter substrate-binding protein [Rhodospirillaceae bacterium]|nr:molybdate ABC transporter substrate-binding protein [Rhodospirillaceae bacterium]
MRPFVASLTALVVLAGAPIARADEALVAVAANFAEAIEQLAPKFEASTGHRILATTGSTGKLYAQIKEGAPFHILLSADAKTPAKLAAEGAGDGSSRFTYAVGKLALWSAKQDLIGSDGAETLRAGSFAHLAIANPELAPYGIAAQQTLESLDLWATLQPRIVMGENIGQTHSMVATGNAELGFVALSAVQSPTKPSTGSAWIVPQELFQPIKQDAILTNAGRDNEAARAFLDYLKTDEAHAVIESFGYGIE